MSCRSPFLVCALFIVSISNPVAAEVTVEKNDAGVVVKVDGQLFTNYLVQSGAKPILWPIIGPTGKEMTRAYPMREGVEGEKKDHIHQRSFWFTHGDVNGISFWDEVKTAARSHGTIKHREFVKVTGGTTASIVTKNDWLDPNGKKVCEDERQLAFGANADSRWVDFDITITATDAPVKFGDTKEGSFGVRIPTTMDVDSKLGGRIVSSEGKTDKDAWGKPANWVDYHGPVGGEKLGIAILNHPSSFRAPTHWHVRTYGLFAANPFGIKDFTGKKENDGSYVIETGKSIALRYRVIFHKGSELEAKIAERFDEYAKLKK